MLDYEDYEDYELLEDYEDYEDFEDYEDYEDYEDFGDYEAEDLEEMEALFEAAMMAESELEEDAFLGAIASIASKVLPQAIKIGKKVIPKVFGAAKKFVSQARKNPTVRRAGRAGVGVVTKTAQDMLRQYSRGQPVSMDYALRRGAHHTADYLPHVVYGRSSRGHGSRMPRRRRRRMPRRRHPHY